MARSSNRAAHAAFVLHSHDWSESSLILELFTRDAGRVAAVAKGAKRPYSQLRPVLLPFQRLTVGFGARKTDEAEVWLLRQAEWAGGVAWPGGAALLPGFYLNELLMRLLVRHDPHPALFDAYAQTLQAMAAPNLLQVALRAFELHLLRQLGLLPDLSCETLGLKRIEPHRHYSLHPEFGVRVWDEQPGAQAFALPGDSLLAVERVLRAGVQPDHALSENEHDAAKDSVIPALMAACVPMQSELKSVTRSLIHYHLGSQTLRTRALMLELQQP